MIQDPDLMPMIIESLPPLPVPKSKVGTKFQCYFSEINDIAQQLSHGSLDDLKFPTQPLSMIKTKQPNCTVEVQDYGLSVVSKGGVQFNIPLEELIQTIYPMSEGLLVQFIIKQELKFSEILHLQKNKNLMYDPEYNQDKKYSYVTINKHPLNPLKYLNLINNGNLEPWKYVSEEVLYVDPKIPFMISYDHLLQRNVFHVLRINSEEIARENLKLTFINNSYNLKAVCDSEFTEGQIITQVLYEQNRSQAKFTNPSLIMGRNNREFILNVNSNDVIKTYLIKLVKTLECNPVSQITNVKYSEAINFFDKNVHRFDLISEEDEPIAQIANIANAIVSKEIKELKQFFMVIDSQNYILMFNGEVVYKRSLVPHPSIYIQQVQKTSQNVFQITTTNQKVFNINTPNQLNDAITINILNILSNVIHPEVYIKLLTEYLIERQKQILTKSQFEVLKECLVHFFKIEDIAQLNHNTLKKYKEIIFNILHLFYEELKLHQYLHYVEQMNILLFNISVIYCIPQKDLHSDYYLRDGAPIVPFTRSKPNVTQSYQPIFDIFKYIREMINFNKEDTMKQQDEPITSIPIAFKRTKFVVQLFEILIDGQTGHRSKIPQFVKNKGLQSTLYKLSTLPIFVQTIFQQQYYKKKTQGFFTAKEMFFNIQYKEQKAFMYIIENGLNLQDIKTYPSSISIIIYQLLRMMREHLPGILYTSIPELGFNLIRRQDIYRNIKFYKRITIKPAKHLQNNSLKVAIQSLIHTPPSETNESYYLNSNPFQMNKQNNNLVFDQVERLLSSTDDIVIKHKELENIPEDKWELESQSIVGKFVNRRLSVMVGQGAFTWGTSQAFITESVKIPKISVTAMMPNDMKVTLDLKEDKESTMHHWAEFHNGVVSGLKLSKHIMPQSEDHMKTWIFFQKPQTDNPKLDTLQRHHAGFLYALGLMGYLKCFSATDIYQYLKPNSQLISIALLLGISASMIGRGQQYIAQTLIIHILPSTLDMDIPMNVQTAALIGIGLVHKATCNKTMVEMTLSQISRVPACDKNIDREGYSMASGWALGVVCLGSRGKAPHLDDLELDKRLIRFIEGGKNLDIPLSMVTGSFNRDAKSSSIREGQNVNSHVAAPPALLALSFIYLKSNNREISDQVTIPGTFNMIQECNPNHVLLKVICKNLIMWDEIENTSEFLLALIPNLIKFTFENSIQKVHENYYLTCNVSEIDYHSITVIYQSCLTGGLVAMALKYAGTSDPKAVALVKENIEKLAAMKVVKFEFANDPINKNCIDQYTLFTLLSTNVLAMSLIVAGTCDQECLRIVKGLKRRIQQTNNFHYGFNMAINMAIGFICLGYGNYSFKRTDLGIACLLLSIYPMFPNSPYDNKWHLQALRHMYVLAVQEKVFHAVDVDNNKVVNTKIEMTYLDGDELKKEKVNTPILLQQSKKLLSVRVIDNDYFDIDFDFDNAILSEPRVIYVKRKAPKSIKREEYQHLYVPPTFDQSSKTAGFNDQSNFKGLKILQMPKDRPNKLSNLMIKAQNNFQSGTQLKKYQRQVDLKQLYHNFLKQDRLDIFEIYLQLIKTTTLNNINALKIENMKTIGQFYKAYGLIKSIDNQQSTFFSGVSFQSLIRHYNDLIHNQLKKQAVQDDFVKYIKRANSAETFNTSHIYKIVKYLNLPNVHELDGINLFFEKLDVEIKQFVENDPETLDVVRSNVEMDLYNTFPNSSLAVICKIIEVYMGKQRDDKN